jgi:Skp family chaperone for outer membrane proteins
MMTLRSLTTALLAIALALTAAILPAAARAQSKTVAVVDVKEVLDRSLAARSIKKQLSVFARGLSDDAKKMGADLRKEEQELANKRAILAPERFTELRRELARKAQNGRRELAEKKKAIDRSANEAMEKVENVFRGIAAEIVEQRKLDLLLRKSAVIHSSGSVDVTAEVLKKLDQRLPSVQVPKPDFKKP